MEGLMGMKDLKLQVDRIVQEFAEQATQIARDIAMEALRSALVYGARPSAGFEAPYLGDAQCRPEGGRRRSEDLAALSRRFVAFVRAHPGLRIEQINREMGTQTKDLALPIRKLVADRVVRTRGRRRSTTYFVEEQSHTSRAEDALRDYQQWKVRR